MIASEEVRLTIPEHVTELLADREQKDFHPKLGTYSFGHTKSPSSALDIARVLPHGADAALEEMHGVLHFELLQGELVDAFPEGLDGDDVFEEAGEAVFVGVAGRVVFLVVEGPGVAEGWRADLAQHVQFHGASVAGCGGGWGGGFGDAG